MAPWIALWLASLVGADFVAVVVVLLETLVAIVVDVWPEEEAVVKAVAEEEVEDEIGSTLT